MQTGFHQRASRAGDSFAALAFWSGMTSQCLDQSATDASGTSPQRRKESNASACGGWGGTESACQSLRIVLVNFGFLVFGVTDYVSKLTTAHYGAITAREPREPVMFCRVRRLGRSSNLSGPFHK